MKRFLNCSELIHGFIADWCVPGYGHNINWHWAIGKDAWSISEREGVVTFCYNQNIRKDIYIHSPILTNWGWVTHIPISELTIIGSDNGLSPGRRQTITWTNINWNLRKKLHWHFKQNSYIFVQKLHLKMSCAMVAILSQPQCVKYLSINNIWLYSSVEGLFVALFGN